MKDKDMNDVLKASKEPSLTLPPKGLSSSGLTPYLTRISQHACSHCKEANCKIPLGP